MKVIAEFVIEEGRKKSFTSIISFVFKINWINNWYWYGAVK